MIDHFQNRPSLDDNPPCFVCGQPVLDGDEPGWVPMDNGNGSLVPNCSEECAEEFFQEDS